MSSLPVKATAIQDVQKNPSLLLVAVASVFLMGLGQLINRQWIKAALFFTVPVLFVAIELGTGSWDKMDEGYRNDYVQYFTGLVKDSLDDQSAAFTAASETAAYVGTPYTELMPLNQGGNGIEGRVVQILADFGPDKPHGYLLTENIVLGLLSAKAGTEVTSWDDAQLQSLVPYFLAAGKVTADRLAMSGTTYSMLPPAVVTWAEPNLSSASTDLVIRTTLDLVINDTDLGYYYEYVSADVAKAAVGPLPREGEVRYPVRDYGGYFTRSLWGLVTLGVLVDGESYRGLFVEAFNQDRPWASADDSSKLLARGLIAIVGLMFLLFAWVMNVVDAFSARRSFLKSGKVQGFVAYLKELWETSYVWILIAPSMILIAFFTVIPFLYTFLCSFTNWTYRIFLMQSLIEWNGIAEYLTVFAEPAWLEVFFQVFLWTVIWALASSVTVYVTGFAHALVIESPLVRGKKIWRTIMIIPWAMPALISLLAFRNVFDKDGLMNQILLATNMMKPVSDLLFGIGLQGQPDDIIFWFDPPYNANLAKFVAIMVNLWLGAPYFMMLMTGIMSTIPADRYEAAMIDGASAYQKFRYITLPLVVTATIPAMVMTVTFNFNNFGAVYFLTGGGPAWLLENLPDSLRTWSTSMPGQTDILISWIYKISFNASSQLYNKAAVYTVFIFLILGIFSVVNMKMTKAFDDEGSE